MSPETRRHTPNANPRTGGGAYFFLLLFLAGCASDSGKIITAPHITTSAPVDVTTALAALKAELKSEITAEVKTSITGNTGIAVTSYGGILLFIVVMAMLGLGLLHMWLSHYRAVVADKKVDAIVEAVQAEPPSMEKL